MKKQVHIERVELNAGLRVPGDDASDGVRKKRARKHEFEKWERIKGGANVNIVQGGLPMHLPSTCTALVKNVSDLLLMWLPVVICALAGSVLGIPAPCLSREDFAVPPQDPAAVCCSRTSGAAKLTDKQSI